MLLGDWRAKVEVNTLMDEGEGKPETVGYGRGAFGAACVGADDDGVAVVGDVLLNIPF